YQPDPGASRHREYLPRLMAKWKPSVIRRGMHQPAALSGRILRGFGATAGSIITAGEIGRFQRGLNKSAAPDAGAALMEEIEGSGADMTGAPRRGGSTPAKSHHASPS